jgi:hypothetical protein
MNARVKGMLEYGASRVARTRPAQAAATAVAVFGAYLGYRKWEQLRRDRPATVSGAEVAVGPNGGETARDVRWGDDMQKLEEIAARGQEFYHRLRKKLELECPSQCIFINTDTGDYVLGSTFGETHHRFVERFGDAPSWDARIGEAPNVFDRTRLLQ